MKKYFQESMQQLHTWAGLMIGSILLLIFVMGTLSVFNKEIDRWMIPETRYVLDEKQVRKVNIDQLLKDNAKRFNAPDKRLHLMLPTQRIPIFSFWYKNEADKWQGPHVLNPIDAKPLD